MAPERYALQASALNVFVHALVRHPILREEKWVWAFLGLSRRDLSVVQSVCDTQSSKQQHQSHFAIPVCDPTRPLLPAFEMYFHNLPQWLAFRVQTAMFGRVNSQLRFRLKASEARFERLTYRSALPFCLLGHFLSFFCSFFVFFHLLCVTSRQLYVHALSRI